MKKNVKFNSINLTKRKLIEKLIYFTNIMKKRNFITNERGRERETVK